MTAQSWIGKRLASLRTPRQRIGDEGEQQALLHLQQAGLRLIQRNFLCKGGEIDLIMQDGGSLVFVEVRKRASAQFGGAWPASRLPSKNAWCTRRKSIYKKFILPRLVVLM